VTARLSLHQHHAHYSVFGTAMAGSPIKLGLAYKPLSLALIGRPLILWDEGRDPEARTDILLYEYFGKGSFNVVRKHSLSM